MTDIIFKQRTIRHILNVNKATGADVIAPLVLKRSALTPVYASCFPYPSQQEFF